MNKLIHILHMVCITALSHGMKYDTHPLHIYGIKRA